MEYNAIGISYGELALKGKNRGTFEKKLRQRITRVMKGINYTLINDSSKPYVITDNIDESLIRLKKVFGIVKLTPSLMIDKDMDKIKENILLVANNYLEKGSQNFKVEVKRNDKKFPIRSMDFAKELGGHVLLNTNFESVKMKNPDTLIKLEIRDNAYFSTYSIDAYGGLPMGSTGRGLVLLSGGIDSPVAAFMIAKRGMEVDAVTFHSFPFTSQQALEKVKGLSEILSLYLGDVKLYAMNILPIQQIINEKTDKDYATILTRRVMMRLSERLSKEKEYRALITGESLGQVASQTIGGLNATNIAVNMPVFRPLIGLDKVDIIKISKEIETYEKSIEPYEDACVIFAPKKPVTNPRIDRVEEEESKIENYESVLDEIYNNMEIFRF